MREAALGLGNGAWFKCFDWDVPVFTKCDESGDTVVSCHV